MSNKDFKVKNGLDVSTPIPVSMGGTGQTSAENTLNSLLPLQTDHSGKVLKTDGTNTSWFTIPAAYTRGVTSQRPPSPTAGDLFFNTEKKAFEVWTGSVWVSVAVNGAVPLPPTIGTVTSTGLTASIPFTGPNDFGDAAISTYTATSSPGSISASSASSPISISGLTASTAYTFTVTAINSYGVSNSSSASNSITTAGVPGAPTSVTASDTGIDGEALIGWTAPGSNGGSSITDYIVDYSSNGGSSWTTFSDGTSTGISATVTGLTIGTTYIFRVKAVNVIGTGTASSSTSNYIPVIHDPNAIFPIGTYNVMTAASTFTIPSIPSTYSHLRIYTYVKTSRSAQIDPMYLQFNGDTGNNYSHTGTEAESGPTVAGFNAQSQNKAYWGRAASASGASRRGVGVIDIYNYSNTNIKKTFNSISGIDYNGGGNVVASVGAWESTSAINSITFIPGVGPNILTGTVFQVYGIK